MRICLAVLAKNDAARIGRCLASAWNVVDHLLVIDTGSTDSTARIARDAGAEVIEREWIHAGHNRTELVALAVQRGDWVLTLDSDEELVVNGPLLDLDAPCYLLDVLMPGTKKRYVWPKLLRSDITWRYVGRAHEHLEPTFFEERRPLPALSVLHHHDREDRVEKLAEVRDQLVQALEENPNDARSTFYLAQTLRDMGDTTAAIAMYRARAFMGGWDEEVWYASFEAARLSCDFEGLLACYRQRPWRYEPLYALSQLARIEADHTPDPEGESLFVHDRGDTFVWPKPVASIRLVAEG